jgi:hypothetical protein
MDTLKKLVATLQLTEDERAFLLLFFAAAFVGGGGGCALAYWIIDIWVCSCG